MGCGTAGGGRLFRKQESRWIQCPYSPFASCIHTGLWCKRKAQGSPKPRISDHTRMDLLFSPDRERDLSHSFKGKDRGFLNLRYRFESCMRRGTEGPGRNGKIPSPEDRRRAGRKHQESGKEADHAEEPWNWTGRQPIFFPAAACRQGPFGVRESILQIQARTRFPREAG